MTIKENAIQIIEEVKQLNSDVIIIAASKTQSEDSILEAKAAGINYFAENRVQEFVKKQLIGVNWHFIGNLQKNKVKYLVGKVQLIHSVDSIDLVDEINRIAHNKNVIQDILIEINVGKETSKSGVLLENFDNLYNYALKLQNVVVCGIMAVMPKNSSEELYLIMKELYDRIKNNNPNIKYLSMGMSNDYVTAIKYGANIIRLGTKIFGSRNYENK